MRLWQLRKNKAFWPVVIGLPTLALSLFYWPSSHRLSFEEAQALLPKGRAVKFEAYSKKDLKKQNLKSQDFLFDAAANRQTAVDPRASVGHKDRVTLHEYYPSGVFLEWDYTVEVSAKDGDSIDLIKKGHVRLPKEEWIEFDLLVQCRPTTARLSSGVVRRELSCETSARQNAWDTLDLEVENCRVEPFGPRSRKTEVKYGRGRTKSATKYSRLIQEDITLDGEVICGGEKQGLGREITQIVYSYEYPNLMDPSTGIRKELYRLSNIKLQTGQVMRSSREEVLGSEQPAMEKAPEIRKSKRLARK